MRRLPAVALVIGALAIGGCRIEDRSPTGTRRDDDAIRALVATYYQSVGTHDWATSRSLFWDSAAVELRGPAPAEWRTFRTADAYHQFLSRSFATAPALAVRMFRLDIRQQGDLASAWVITRRRPTGQEGRGEVGTADNLLLWRRDGAWRILALASVPDSAPASR